MTVRSFYDARARRLLEQIPTELTPPEDAGDRLATVITALGLTFQIHAVGRELARLGRRAVQNLIELLGDAPEMWRLAVIYALGELGDTQAVGVLTRYLAFPDPLARQRAADALGRIGDEAARPALEEALHDSDPHVRVAAMEALVQLPREAPAEWSRLDGGSPQTRLSAMDELCRDCPGGVPVEVFLHALRDEHADVRVAAMGHLCKREDEALTGVMLASLHDPEWRVAKPAALWLRPRARQLVARLIPKLDGRGRHVRLLAARLLDKTRDPRIVAPMGEALLGSRSAKLSKVLTRSLARFKTPAALACLEKAMLENLKTRDHALAAIRQIGGDGAVAALERGIEACGFQGCGDMVNVLGRIDSTETNRVLLRVVTEGGGGEHAWACESLVLRKATESIEALEAARETLRRKEGFSDHSLRPAITELKALRGDEPTASSAVPDPDRLSLEAALGSTDASVRFNGLRRLTDDDVQSHGATIESLVFDCSPDVRKLAVEILMRCDPDGLRARLVQRLGWRRGYANTTVRVVETLEIAGDESVLNDIFPYLCDREAGVRDAAERALRKLGCPAVRIDEVKLTQRIRDLLDAGRADQTGALGNAEVDALRRLAVDFRSRDWGGAATALARIDSTPRTDVERLALLLVAEDAPDPAELAAEMLPAVGAAFAGGAVERPALGWLAASLKAAGPAARPYLLDALSSPSESIRTIAADMLTAQRLVDAEDIRTLLEGDSPHGRAMAARLAGEMEAVELVPDLVEALEQEQWHAGPFDDANAAGWIARALGKLGDRQAVPVLARAFGGGLPEAAEALGELGGAEAELALVSQLRGRLGNKAALGLRRMGWTPANDLDAAYMAVRLGDWRALASFGRTAFEPLERCLIDYSIQATAVPIRWLGEIQDPAAISLLVKCLRIAHVQSAVVDALLSYGEFAVPELLDLSELPSCYAKRGAARVLAKLRHPDSEDVLLALLQEDWVDIKKPAADGLGRLRSRKAVPLLIKNLVVPDPVVRRAVVDALGKINDPAALEPIRRTRERCDRKLQAAFDKVIAKLEKSAARRERARQP